VKGDVVSLSYEEWRYSSTHSYPQHYMEESGQPITLAP